MEIKELRIGNWYVFDTEERQWSFDDMINMEFESSYIGDSIKLTEQWLDRMADRQGDTNTWIIDNWIMLKLEDDIWEEACFDIYMLRENESPYYITCLEWVHHIQNLYHSLTYVELEIKEG